MEGVRYLVDEQNNRIAVQLDYEKYGEPLEELLDVAESEQHKGEKTITLDGLKQELKQEGKL